MAFKIRGTAARIDWGYYVAATLGAWTIEDQVLTATITQADRYRVTQRPLDFVVPGGRWTLLDVTVEPRELRATVGPVQ